jgi:hypothetical protein
LSEEGLPGRLYTPPQESYLRPNPAEGVVRSSAATLAGAPLRVPPIDIRAGGASKDCVGADSEDEARGGRRPDVRIGDPEPPQRCIRRRAGYQKVLRRLHEGLLRSPGGTACTSEPPTPITSYVVPPLSKLGLMLSRLGLIPELRGERQSSRWKEARMDRAKMIQWQ